MEPYLLPEDRFITFIFGRPEEKKGKRTICTRATEAKMARGEMVRFLSEIQAADPETAKAFNRLNYAYSEEDSTSSEFVFLKQPSMPE